jgi:hypothetical protein
MMKSPKEMAEKAPAILNLHFFLKDFRHDVTLLPVVHIDPFKFGTNYRFSRNLYELEATSTLYALTSYNQQRHGGCGDLWTRNNASDS